MLKFEKWNCGKIAVKCYLYICYWFVTSVCVSEIKCFYQFAWFVGGIICFTKESNCSESLWCEWAWWNFFVSRIQKMPTPSHAAPMPRIPSRRFVYNIFKHQLRWSKRKFLRSMTKIQISFIFVVKFGAQRGTLWIHFNLKLLFSK